jgi:DNA-binding transcriptional MerR regulator
MLLRDKKYTIEGAKRILEDYSPDQNIAVYEKEATDKSFQEDSVEIKKDKQSLKKDLEEIKSILEFILKRL